MADVILSESPVRDPFQTARNQHDSRKSGGDVLSSSPVSNGNDALMNPQPPDLNALMQGMGLGGGIAPNDIGRVQLIGRLREKFGEQYMEAEGVADLLKAFDAQANGKNEDGIMAFNKSMSNANRTLKALFGGK